MICEIGRFEAIFPLWAFNAVKSYSKDLFVNKGFCSLARREHFLSAGILDIFRALKSASNKARGQNHYLRISPKNNIQILLDTSIFTIRQKSSPKCISGNQRIVSTDHSKRARFSNFSALSLRLEIWHFTAFAVIMLPSISNISKVIVLPSIIDYRAAFTLLAKPAR